MSSVERPPYLLISLPFGEAIMGSFARHLKLLQSFFLKFPKFAPIKLSVREMYLTNVFWWMIL